MSPWEFMEKIVTMEILTIIFSIFICLVTQKIVVFIGLR